MSVQSTIQSSAPPQIEYNVGLDRNILPLSPIADDFRWSFSSLTTYETCPKQFALQYLVNPRLPQENNAFAQQGTLCHSLLEEYAKGTLAEFAMADEYKLRYDDAVTAYFPPFPKGFAGKAYNACLDYFENFSGFGEHLAVLDVEDKFEIDVGGNTVVGIADLICIDTRDDSLVVIDHKTTSESSFQKKKDEYRKQLYIYAAHVKQKYGVFPKLLRFNLLKPQTYHNELFSEECFDETMQWITDTIAKIKSERNWEAIISPYFCKFLCGVSQYCSEGTSLWEN